MAYKFQKGAAIMSGALAQEGTLEVLDDAGGLQGQMTSAGVVSGSGNFQGGGTATFASSVTAGTSFIIGSADLNETDMEKLDGITNGTAAANKAVVLDGSKNIATIGTIGCGAITSTGTSAFAELDISGDIDVDGTTNLDAVDIDGAVQVDSTITVGVDDTGYDVKFFGDTASAYMLWDTSADDLILAGAAGLSVASKTTLSGELEPAGVAAAAIAVADDSVFFLDSDGLMKKTTQVLYAQALVASEPGFASAGGKLQYDPNSLSAATPASGDALSFVDSNDGNIPKKATLDAFVGVIAGTGIGASGVSLSLDLNELSAAAVDVSADSIAFIDATDDSTKKESIADLVAGMAGAGLSASGGQLSAAGSGDSISVASVADSGTMAAGLNYTATQTGAITVSLPAVAAAQDGDVVYLKANSGTSSTNKITVSCDTGDKIDGVANGTVIVESPFASVGFIYVHATTNWALI